MANANDYKFDHFNVTFPAEYVAHVEINRPDKLNAFFEQYVLSFSSQPRTPYVIVSYIFYYLFWVPFSLADFSVPLRHAIGLLWGFRLLHGNFQKPCLRKGHSNSSKFGMP